MFSTVFQIQRNAILSTLVAECLIWYEIDSLIPIHDPKNDDIYFKRQDKKNQILFSTSKLFFR